MKTLEEVIKDRTFILSIFSGANVIKTKSGFVVQKLEFLFKDYKNLDTRTIFKNLKSFIYNCFSCLCCNEKQQYIDISGKLKTEIILSIGSIFNIGFNFYSFKNRDTFKFNFFNGIIHEDANAMDFLIYYSKFAKDHFFVQ